VRRVVTVHAIIALVLLVIGCSGEEAPAALVSGPPSDPTFTLEPLPLLPGGARAGATAVNTGDDAVGYSSVPSSPAHPVMWVGSVAIDLGLPPGAVYAVAYDINDARMVVGETADLIDNMGFVWKDGVFTLIKDGMGPQRLAATAVNNNGVVVGQNRGHAFRYSAAAGLTNIHPGDAYELSYAQDISDAGVIVGSVKPTGGVWRAAHWSETGVFTDLGSLGGDTWASGVRDDGTVVGNASGPDGAPQAFVWTQATGLRADGGQGESNGISSNGRVVGTIIEGGATGRISHPSSRIGSGAMVILPTLTEQRIGRAIAVNHCGSVVGEVAVGTRVRAALWRISRCD
jgi:hypothetical protein